MSKNFDYLGQTFQLQLINQIILDKEFARAIIDFLKVYPNLKNEIGFICTESIKNYIKTHKYEI